MLTAKTCWNNGAIKYSSNFRNCVVSSNIAAASAKTFAITDQKKIRLINVL